MADAAYVILIKTVDHTGTNYIYIFSLILFIVGTLA